jgi:serine protease Do
MKIHVMNWQLRLIIVTAAMAMFFAWDRTCRCGFAQDQINGFFRTAIETSQKRVVKVFGAGAGRVESYASGIIVSDDGKIITMQGVFLDGQQIRVTLHDGTTHQARVLKRDRKLQIALLKIDVATPDFFELSDKSVGEKGDWVVTVSNAFKVADKREPLSVNLGIISLETSMTATLTAGEVAFKGPMVLIDAITSNPGAAGGAVVNVDGKLVGMIGKIITSSETNTRINYAVPNPSVKQFVDGDLVVANTKEEKTHKPADLGLRLFRIGGRREPAYIDRVAAEGPASEASLRPDDLIISINGTKIATIKDYDAVLQKIAPGDEVIVVVKRGETLIRVVLEAAEK